MKNLYIIFVSLSVVLIIAGCGSSTPVVTRTSVDQIPDFSGRWNENDNRMVSEQMTLDMLSSPWLSNFRSDTGRKPVLIVGTIRNLSSEHIETQSFIKTMESQITNSGKARIVASKNERLELREERLEQQSYASDESMKALAQEQGADIMLQGSIKSTRDEVEGKAVVTYQIDLELVNLETNEKLWIGSMPISKFITRDRTKW